MIHVCPHLPEGSQHSRLFDFSNCHLPSVTFSDASPPTTQGVLCDSQDLLKPSSVTKAADDYLHVWNFMSLLPSVKEHESCPVYLATEDR